MLLFSIYDENNEVIAKNRFRTVASPGTCGRLIGRRDARRQYMLLVKYVMLSRRQPCRFHQGCRSGFYKT